MHRQTLRMSVLSGILRIHEYCSLNPGTDPSTAAALLKSGSAIDAGFDYHAAVSAIAALSLKQPNRATPIETLQTIITTAIVHFRPPWATAIPYGRSQLVRLLSPDEQQCLASARLLESNPPDNVVAWWDHLATLFRTEVNAANNATGRHGEQLSLRYERARLLAAGRGELTPRWVSIDDNSLGYDIASFEASVSHDTPRFIEVKATSSSPPQFFVTRNEWRAALRLRPRYFFHVWDLSMSRLAEISAEELSSHVPCDQGLGKWQQVRIELTKAYWAEHSNVVG